MRRFGGVYWSFFFFFLQIQEEALDKEIIYLLNTVGAASGWIKVEDPTYETVSLYYRRNYFYLSESRDKQAVKRLF